MRVLIFGGTGQLGFELQKRANDLNFEFIAPVTSEVDISELEQVKYLAAQTEPDIIINCAAYTAVDKAEEESTRAFKINRDGLANVALAAKEIDCRLIGISTDYVFDGTASKPISEDAPTNPINVYGASKLAGEKEATKILGDKVLLLRTSSLHGQKGVNFVHTMLKLFEEREVVKVVNDQYMSPTWAGWLAEVVLDLCRIECSGILHASCSGVISWFDFAVAILDFARAELKNGERVKIEPIGCGELARPAKRPKYSALDCGKLATVLGRKPLNWKEGLKEHLKEIGYQLA